MSKAASSKAAPSSKGESGRTAQLAYSEQMAAMRDEAGRRRKAAKILAVLRRTKTPATFFQVGKNLEENPDPAHATTLLDRVLATVAALVLTVTAVGAAVGPVQPNPGPAVAAPAALVVAMVSSQAWS